MASATDMKGNDDKLRIVFHPDYIDFGGTHYLDFVVNFTQSSVEAKSKSCDRDGQSFYILMDIDDIVKIESQWSARCGAGIVRIYFISNSAHEDGSSLKDSGIQELKFPAIDTNWHKKLEAIRTLNVRYKALWNVLLDTGVERSSPLPEGKDMLQRRRYFPKFDKPFGALSYCGDSDTVLIRKGDVDGLLPGKFVNSAIMDFYINYLERNLTTEQKAKFHLFSCFFFQLLSSMDRHRDHDVDVEAAFQRIHKWTRNVNFLEKDFIFIPVNVNDSLHWSLIVICYFGEAAVDKDAADDKITRVPCILHLNSIKGTHTGLEDLMRSFLWEEWKARKKETCQGMYSKFQKLKFVSLEVPQQQNSYDCGMFVLHYIERFLEEVPPYFNIHNFPSSSIFVQPDWFPPCEPSLKRAHIRRLIKDFHDNISTDSAPCFESNMDGDSDDLADAQVEISEVTALNGRKTSGSNFKESSPGKPSSKRARIKMPVRVLLERQTSGEDLKELVEEGAKDAATCGSMASLHDHELETPISLTQEDVEVAVLDDEDTHDTQPRRSARMGKTNKRYFNVQYLNV